MTSAEMKVKGIEQLPEVAEWLLEAMGSHRLLATEGEMGAGKTTFIKSLCTHMGVEDEVSSPTFSLVNEYSSPKYGSIYHFDFYRLKNEAEALDFGVEDYLYSGGYCFMEWPEKICNLIPAECPTLKIRVEEDTRVFSLNLPGHE
jgi:tRNA threonylcarbamoyladenosine biosynthesis protein TsaE